MKGYWQRPEETAKVIDAEGWLHTGDMAKMDERGFFYIVDRKKDMILVSGFNVYPNEVEDVIAMMPGVLEVAAVGVPDDKSGEAVKVVIVKKDPIPHRRTGQGARPREPDRLQAARGSSSSAPSCPRPTSARSCAANCATAPNPDRAANRPECGNGTSRSVTAVRSRGPSRGYHRNGVHSGARIP